MTGTRPRGDGEAEEGRSKPSIPVVGIGASAGGIDALQAFIPAIPPACGLSFVVVQHLDPEHGSVLSSLLSRVSRIPVTEVKGETEIEPNHIYVILPNTTLTIADDRLQTAKPLA